MPGRTLGRGHVERQQRGERTRHGPPPGARGLLLKRFPNPVCQKRGKTVRPRGDKPPWPVEKRRTNPAASALRQSPNRAKPSCPEEGSAENQAARTRGCTKPTCRECAAGWGSPAAPAPGLGHPAFPVVPDQVAPEYKVISATSLNRWTAPPCRRQPAAMSGGLCTLCDPPRPRHKNPGAALTPFLPLTGGRPRELWHDPRS